MLYFSRFVGHSHWLFRNFLSPCDWHSVINLFFSFSNRSFFFFLDILSRHWTLLYCLACIMEIVFSLDIALIEHLITIFFNESTARGCFFMLANVPPFFSASLISLFNKGLDFYYRCETYRAHGKINKRNSLWTGENGRVLSDCVSSGSTISLEIRQTHFFFKPKSLTSPSELIPSKKMILAKVKSSKTLVPDFFPYDIVKQFPAHRILTIWIVNAPWNFSPRSLSLSSARH